MDLPFSTTLYTLEDDKEGSSNYLGIAEYVKYWTDKLFPQFTILTNNPREHGILCAILKYINDNSLENKRTTFRNFEAFWGLLLTSQEDIDSPINVTKYQKVLETRKTLSLPEVQKQRNLYNRLGYGLFGFYINPSIKWHLVKPDKFTLTSTGEKLADYFLNNLGLRKYYKDWNKGNSFEFAKMGKLAKRLQYKLPPNELNGEKNIWKDVKELFLKHCPEVKAQWEIDLNDLNLEELLSDAKSYTGFLESIHNRYIELNQEMLARSVQCLIFLEKAFAISEFIFDFEYLARSQYNPAAIKFEIEEDLKMELIESLKEHIGKYSELAVGTKIFPPFKGDLTSYSSYLESLIKRHNTVQARKKKAIYMNETEVLSLGEINSSKAETVLTKNREDQLQEIYFQYRKDWHFIRFLKYYRYMC